MRYHHERPTTYTSEYGETYVCDHPVYKKCTLFRINNKGLAVIQQRYNKLIKTSWWSEIDPWMTDIIFLHPMFQEYFDERANTSTDGLYPTVTIRQLMWALKMKPIPRQRFDELLNEIKKGKES